MIASVRTEGQLKVLACVCGHETKARPEAKRIKCTNCCGYWEKGIFHPFVDEMNMHGTYIKSEAIKRYRWYRMEGSTKRYLPEDQD